jgi:hypothetical protein
MVVQRLATPLLPYLVLHGVGEYLLGYSVAPEMFVPYLRAANISRALWWRGRLYCWLTQGLGRSMAGISFLRPASIAADTRIATGGPSS